MAGESGGGAGALGGAGGTAAGGGGGGIFEPPPQRTATKVDLLLVVDNSISMDDKQELLAVALPPLVTRLVNPACVDASGMPVLLQPSSPDDPCPAGSSRQTAPVRDLHVGLVSSSLGGHGGDICSPSNLVSFNPTQDDRGELVLPLRGVGPAEGFLSWVSGQDPSVLLSQLGEAVTAVGGQGCGYEATNEAWYRFLVDPEPPATITKDASGVVLVEGVNQTILSQRAAFLRPDSAVVILVLSDENDCSVRDGGMSWLVADLQVGVPRARAICATAPNDPCCRSCADVSADATCGASASDPECAKGTTYPRGEEPVNLRCFQQKQRFGFDFLHPVDRYVEALTSETVSNRAGQRVPNPLFGAGRDASLVTYVGVVGVPWQALAAPNATGLRFKPAMELHADGTWPALVGDVPRFIPPQDPFMQESIDPRSGTRTVSGLATEPPGSVSAASPANGHEYTILNRDDLQFACIFELAEPRDCAVDSGGGCDCFVSSVSPPDSPLCQPPGSAVAGTTQYFAKAYPGLRHLEIMRRLGPLAVPASICPAEPLDATAPDYGYAPVVESLIARLETMLE